MQMTNFHIYKASAGSGKTYTLVKEYIKNCLSSNSIVSHKALLAITFTNKAAGEMKDRIISTLFNFSQGKKIDFYEDLRIELGYTDQDFQKKSQKSLSDIIHYYSSFSVSTIDKFIHSIIRNFSYELDLPANFDVEMDSKKLIQDSVFNLLDDVGIDKALTTNLISFSEHKTSEKKYWDIEKDLLDVGKELFKDSAFFSLDQISNSDQIKRDKVSVKKQIINFEKKIQNHYDQIKNIIEGIPETAFIYKDLPNYLKKIKNKSYKELGIKEDSRLYNSINNQIWYSKSLTQELKDKIDLISYNLNSFFIDYLSFLEKQYSNYLFYKQYYNSLFQLSVLTKINDKIQKNKRENNIVHISEFNQIIHYFLNHTSAPFIYEKIGNRYLHHFIDEFQDTSTIQWQNLLPLIENSLGSGGSCLIVGDGKQSIYRWRGGEVEQFLQLCDEDKEHPLNHFSPKIHSLDINRRSAQKIVEFNNKFFSFLASKLDDQYHNLYSNLSQKKHIKDEGYVEVDIINSENLEDILIKTLERTHKTILDIKNDNYNFSDIFILTRTNHEITKIATYLSERGVPVISSEALLLETSKIIQFLLNILRIIFDENDKLSRARVIEYLIINKIIQTEIGEFSQLLYDYSTCSNDIFKAFLDSKSINYDLYKYVNLNLYELVENIIRDFKIEVDNNLFITFFLDFVLDYTVNKNNSIRDFLNEWELKKSSLSIVIPNGINAVELMTIHKSKGLEFPIVIFPFANWKEDLGSENKWFPLPSSLVKNKILESTTTLLPIKRELEQWPPPFPNYYRKNKQKVFLDNINLLYVALTRAKKRLYIYTNTDYRRGNTYSYFTDFFESQKLIKDTKFSLGSLSKKQDSKELSNSSIKTRFFSFNWRDRVKIKKKYFFDKDIKIKYAINWGHLIHNIMSEIHTEDDVDVVLNKYLTNRMLNGANMNTIKIQITSILKNSVISHLFQPNLQSFSEYSILSKNGVLRPDRVVVHSIDMVSLIDYKTGEKRKSHVIQMDNYEKILLEMGYKNVEKYLVYLTQSNVQKLL